jgi:hypothetical protein
MKKLLDELIAARHQANGYYDEKSIPPSANPPAPPQDLAMLTTVLRQKNLSFPPSYRQLLSVYNGIYRLFEEPALTLLSARDVALGKHDILAKDFPELSRFVIAAGDTSEFISFDPAIVDAQGEMGVVHVNGYGDETRGDNLMQFLLDYQEYLKNVIDGNKADRDALKDD